MPWAWLRYCPRLKCLPFSYTLGGGTTTATQSFEYWKLDDSTRSPFAALKRIRLSKGTTDLVDREMRYDAAGNVTRIVDGINTETVDYTYDDLDRLLTASVPAGESFAYDKIGNMTSKAGTTLSYGTTAPKHAVKSHGTTNYTYDANGSMTARGTQTIKYDPEQRPILVKDGASVHRASYDGDGVRRKRDDGNGTVHYLGGYERKLAAGADPEAVTKYYSASFGAMSRPIAFRRAGTLHWVGSDHLGGTIRVLNSSFAALDGMRYKPYGEDRDTGSSLVTDRKFTGQTEDETAGLYWYQSRAYDPAIGRFVSPDTIVPEPFNPQSLNRYGYAYNNPLKYVDPTGHYNVYDDKQWLEDFEEQYGFPPTPSDIAYRQASMEAALRGDDFSLEYWKSNAESVARNAFKKVAKYITGGEALAVAKLYSIVTGAGESERNAVQHAYWNARLTEVFWIALAEEITTDHEIWNMTHDGQAVIDLRMDLHNNEVGREIGSRWPRIPGTNLRPRLLGVSLVSTALAANEGKLREIRNGELVPTPVDSLASRIYSRMLQLLGID